MIFKNFELVLKQIEEGVGNRATVMVQLAPTGLRFKIFWPDGYRMYHDAADLAWLEEEIFVLYLIDIARKAHPKLAPTIS